MHIHMSCGCVWCDLSSGLADTNLAGRQLVLQFLKMCVVQSFAYLCRIILT